MAKSFALALGGGGARGSYQAGVWKALRELNVNIVAVAGTSVGAINAAAVAQGEFESTLQLWKEIDFSSIIGKGHEPDDHDHQSVYCTILDYVKTIAEKKGLDITPLRNLLKERVDEDKIQNSKVDFGIVTISITDRKPVILFKQDIPKGQLADYILASANFPAFERQVIDGKRYIDGGLYDNLPVNALIDRGYRSIITVELTPFGVYRKVKADDVELIHIKRSDTLGGTLGFSPELAERNIRMGYYDTRKAFGNNTGKRYYIIKGRTVLGKPIEECDLQILFHGEGEKVLSDLMMKHRILRTLRQYAGEKLDGTNAMVAACEIAAETMEIERLREYTLDELIGEILLAYQSIRNGVHPPSVREFLALHLVNDAEPPGKIILAGLPRYYITSLLIYLMHVRKSGRKGMRRALQKAKQGNI